METLEVITKVLLAISSLCLLYRFFSYVVRYFR